MPDACDRMVDLQLEVADSFTAARVALLTFVRAASPNSADCVGCRSPIEPARLKALPTADRCVFCQQIFERLRG